jgi:hypothetical protein
MGEGEERDFEFVGFEKVKQMACKYMTGYIYLAYVGFWYKALALYTIFAVLYGFQ